MIKKIISRDRVMSDMKHVALLDINTSKLLNKHQLYVIHSNPFIILKNFINFTSLLRQKTQLLTRLRDFYHKINYFIRKSQSEPLRHIQLRLIVSAN